MRSLVFVLIAVSAIALGFKAPPKAAKPTFVKDVKPTLQKLCLNCHTGPYAADKVDLSKIKTEADAKKHLAVLKKGFKEVKAGKMPPAGNPKPSAAEKKAFEGWLKAQK